jgi:enoyl-CoA hydratase/carnithine racemase
VNELPSGLSLAIEDEVATVVIANGDGNLFTNAMIDALARVVAEAVDQGLRCVRVRATGAAFCLGRERAGRTAEHLRSEAERIVAFNRSLAMSPVVVVAEVQGPASGFGAGLVAGADVAVMARSATLSFPEISHGYAPAIVLSWLPRIVPPKQAFRLAALDGSVGADEAVRLGLATEAVEPADLTARVDELMARIRSVDLHALRDVKGFMAATRDGTREESEDAAVDWLVRGTMRLLGS